MRLLRFELWMFHCIYCWVLCILIHHHFFIFWCSFRFVATVHFILWKKFTRELDFQPSIILWVICSLNLRIPNSRHPHRLITDNPQGLGGPQYPDCGGPHVHGGRFRVCTWRDHITRLWKEERGPIAYQMDGPRVPLRQHILGEVGRLEFRCPDMGSCHARQHALSGNVGSGSHEEGKCWGTD